jgi:hypothetical protein
MRQPAPYRPDPRLARTLWQCLALGALVLMLVPPARGPVLLVGQLPLWLLLAPALSLAVLYRHALLARLAPARPRRGGPAVPRRGRQHP